MTISELPSVGYDRVASKVTTSVGWDSVADKSADPYAANITFWHPLRTDLNLAVGSGSVTFTGPANRSYVDPSSGLVKFVGANIPRFEDRGLLLEGSIEQYFLATEDFSDPVWLTDGIITTGFTDPSGGTAAAKLEITTGTTAAVTQDLTLISSGNQKTVSFWAKAGSSSSVRLGFAFGTLETLTLTSTWARYKVEYPVTITDFPAIEVDGDVGDYIYIAFPQCENRRFSTSYFKNASNTVLATRAAETVSIPAGTNVPSAASDYSMACTLTHLGYRDAPLAQIGVHIVGETTRDIRAKRHGADETQIQAGTTAIAGPALVDVGCSRILFTKDATNVNMYQDGVHIASAATTAMAGAPTSISYSTGVDSELYGHLRDVKFWNTVVSSDQ